jgi:hypothetical protein
MEGSAVDDTLHDRAPGRDESADDAANDPATSCDRPVRNPEQVPPLVQPNPETAPATKPIELTATAASFRVRLCKWCSQIDVRGPRRETDVVAILIIGKTVLACWNAKHMIVQDGICEACGDALKNGRVMSERSTAL